ncbi:uncharacterized protein Triagg1_1381 [Trichoderma aggressivum f. europaeum]|uniref:Uncharacterized protein n=1 Tax=Trichoderma aggressivum f. europaeum TaxID=173218 RepID=A0AAE1JGW0_9HYPO|nr:hypothetical protein Triagg1_1381 [Trichoderma aggressivum f. europaeum]
MPANTITEEYQRALAQLNAIMDELEPTVGHSNCRIIRKFRNMCPAHAENAAGIWGRMSPDERWEMMEMLHAYQDSVYEVAFFPPRSGPRPCV